MGNGKIYLAKDEKKERSYTQIFSCKSVMPEGPGSQGYKHKGKCTLRMRTEFKIYFLIKFYWTREKIDCSRSCRAQTIQEIKKKKKHVFFWFFAKQTVKVKDERFFFFQTGLTFIKDRNLFFVFFLCFQ